MNCGLNKTLVLYPAVEISPENNIKNQNKPIISTMDEKPYFLSLNRFERRKNIELAILAYIQKKEKLRNFDLIIAGGLDSTSDNHKYLQELINLAIENGVQ